MCAEFIGRRKIRADHTGARYGAMEVIAAISGDQYGPLVYRVRWLCCGTEDTMGQSTLNTRKQCPSGQCKPCRDAKRPVPQVATPGAVWVPTWGLVFPMVGPMGPRFGLPRDSYIPGGGA